MAARMTLTAAADSPGDRGLAPAPRSPLRRYPPPQVRPNACDGAAPGHYHAAKVGLVGPEGVLIRSSQFQGDGAMRKEIALFAALCCGTASAQVHVSKPKQQATPTPYHKPAPAAPSECNKPYRDPWVDALCKVITRGQPQGSATVVQLPAHGTAQSKSSGYACMGGLAMRRLPNGWEQLKDQGGNFLRCTDL